MLNEMISSQLWDFLKILKEAEFFFLPAQGNGTGTQMAIPLPPSIGILGRTPRGPAWSGAQTGPRGLQPGQSVPGVTGAKGLIHSESIYLLIKVFRKVEL